MVEPKDASSLTVHQGSQTTEPSFNLQPMYPTHLRPLLRPLPLPRLRHGLATAMNRPRNRQPRPPRQQNQRNTRPPRNSPRPPRQNDNPNGPVPTIQQVIPGASVSIVLKEDQPTGRETPGVVQDVLTKGNHPRGIKVRLRDGQVGRVQRMTNSSNTDSAATATTTAAASAGFTMRYTDVRRDDEYPSEPPPRSLADFFPAEPAPPPTVGGDSTGPAQETARCPFCEAFEGDEAAVTYHIDREHLT